ncbi:unnamed protein product [Acanthoscelides obtectus]|uniref:Uncharacterized protein n=1 Tax=Acanthoscelides obtectus TaxID=200917 RepID=A0A9P0LAZ8_ACAOB|nr:unnamed protein product [Acanthoscelides obtectus]CAK1636530.1 hypothetical protein AOBTE_LOCUS9874 [Acanthoscelides obtectus]
MKWLGTGEGDGIIKVEMDRGQHRSQDDAAVGYVFQRPPDPDFNSFGPKPIRWAPGDDSIIENHDKWKYPPPPPAPQQQHQPMPGGLPKLPGEPLAPLGAGSYMAINPYEMTGLGGAKPEHLVYMGGMQYLGQPAAGQLIAGGVQGQQLQPRLAQPQVGCFSILASDAYFVLYPDIPLMEVGLRQEALVLERIIK